jgi:hypothetical protein
MTMTDFKRAARRIVKSFVADFASVWLVVAGFVLITWGACLFMLPVGLIIGGICAVVLDWHVSVERGRRR